MAIERCADESCRAVNGLITFWLPASRQVALALIAVSPCAT